MKELLVRDLMREDFVKIPPQASVATARSLMYTHRVRHLPVVDEGDRLVGLLTHRDLVRDAQIEGYERPVWVEQERLEELPISSYARTLVETVSPDTPLATAGQIMLDNLFGALPVVVGDHLLGMLTEADFVRFAVRGFRSKEPAAKTTSTVAGQEGRGDESRDRSKSPIRGT